MEEAIKRTQIEAVVAKIKLYPGWKISMDDNGDIRIRARVSDAYNKGKRLTVYSYVVDPFRARHEHALMWMIHRAIMDLHHHELAEWFLYEGKRYFDAGH